jgi:hypothetical protein
MAIARRRPLRLFSDVVAPKRRGQVPVGFSNCNEHPNKDDELLACERSFRHFLRHWRFIDRETGVVLTFATLWEGQEEIVSEMELHPQLVLLKAGKLGASELECAFDGWRSRFGGANARVNIFSMDRPAAEQMLTIVRFGLEHLPEYMRFGLHHGAGADNTDQVIYRAGSEDLRLIRSYAPTKKASIDVSSQHVHLDELARMPFPEETYSAVESTVAPGGTFHIVSRGQGAQNFLTRLFRQAKEGASVMRAVFMPWSKRPRHPEGEVMREKVARGEITAARAWYLEQEAAFPTTSQLWYFAPETEEQALAGAAEDAFIDISRWDSCYEPTLPSLQPGDPIPVVLSLDAGVTNDVFAATLVSRNPANVEQPALRGFKAWVPRPGEVQVDFDDPDAWIRTICRGGCIAEHHNGVGGAPSDGQVCSVHPERRFPHALTPGGPGCAGPGVPCPHCAADRRIPRLNIVQIVYDRYELVDMTQGLMRDGIAWCEPMDQGTERTEADTALKTHLLQRDLVHHIDPADQDNLMRVHVQGAKGKVPAGDDNRVRIEKRDARSKVDLLVSLSMGVARCMYLRLGPRSRGGT